MNVSILQFRVAQLLSAIGVFAVSMLLLGALAISSARVVQSVMEKSMTNDGPSDEMIWAS